MELPKETLWSAECKLCYNAPPLPRSRGASRSPFTSLGRRANMVYEGNHTFYCALCVGPETGRLGRFWL